MKPRLDALARLGRRPGRPRGVLLVSAGGLGDTVLFALVLPRFLALAEPGEPVTVLLRRDAAAMAFLFPPGVRVEAVDFDSLRRRPVERLRRLRRLYRAHFRRVVSTDFLRHPRLDEAVVRAAAAPETIAMEPRPWPKWDGELRRNRALYARLWDSGPVRRDKVERWAAFAGWLTGDDQPPPLVRLDPSRLPPPAALDAPTVLIQPFSAVKAKQSPVALYRAIIDSLPDRYRVRLLGTATDLERNPAYADLLDGRRVSFDSARFRDLVPTLRAAALVVSVDTALMHLAVAVGAPTLCLASAAYVGEIVPYAPTITPDTVRFLYQSMPCEGCLGACIHPPEGGMYRCVARLSPGAAVAAVHAALDAGDRS